MKQRLMLPILGAVAVLWLVVGDRAVAQTAHAGSTVIAEPHADVDSSASIPLLTAFPPNQRDRGRPDASLDSVRSLDELSHVDPASTVPPDGWLTGEGYPEPRNFIEAQWHEASDGNLDKARHIHLGAAMPRIVKGLVHLDLRVQHFHFEGGMFESIRKVVVRTPQHVSKVLPAPKKPKKMGLYQISITRHLQETYVPLLLDFRSVQEDGWYLMEVDASTRRPDGRTINVRLQTKVYVANNGTIPEAIVNHVAVETWLSSNAVFPNTFGYLRAEATDVRRFESDPPIEPIIRLKGRLDQDHILLATINPDLHQHPPAYGHVMIEQYVAAVTPKKAPLKLFAPALSVGDRLLLRFGAFDPAEGAGASLILVRVGKG